MEEEEEEEEEVVVVVVVVMVDRHPEVYALDCREGVFSETRIQDSA